MLAYIGSRTTRERNARGEGISLVECNELTGELVLRSISRGWINPSYLLTNKDSSLLYSVHGDGVEVSAFRIDPCDGSITHLNTKTVSGTNPVHLALSLDERSLVISNHLTSGLVVLDILEEGAVGELKQIVTLEGNPGPHRVEQPFSKPHFNPFDRTGQFVVVPDKGLDKVFSFPFRAGKLVSKEKRMIETREGAGPRNLVFHPSNKWVYVINELDSTITSYKFEIVTGELIPFQTISALCEKYTGNSRASGIQVNDNGDILYVSNRGEDSIAVFKINQRTGMLKMLQSVSSEGRTPRFFTLSPNGRWLYVLNEDSDSVITFSVDPNTGKLSLSPHKVSIGSPVCMVFNQRV
ncbi:lactonase family protein [Nitrincola nitratireducens]|uniref:6-phosphogluconolactonase n=1 Tax=Nitrincola nitratireducens TaxID=1229521 RepID=W9V946_9GAMM|nr:lactonase family protein [Nitrincola nitratireducens]EXJ12602.1 hypothetical protein D791_00847 [Nitrincola nitratireducens]